MSQNVTSAKETNHLKRKNPPVPQERISIAAKRPITSTKRSLTSTKRSLTSTKRSLNCTKRPSPTMTSTYSSSNELQFDDTSLKQNNIVEDAVGLSNDGENEVNEKSSKEIATDMDSKVNIPEEAEEEEEAESQSPTSLVPIESLRRQIKFPGFNKEMELVLLKAINTVKPFSAPYANGESSQDCNIDLTVDTRYIELQKAYLFEQDCINSKKARKNRRYHAQTHA
ncbi:hypothetical protein FBU30_008849, partial [Linnemannia zychae]